MFEDTLLESSVKAAPVLRGIHWLISIVIGAAVFLSLFTGEPRLLLEAAQAAAKAGHYGPSISTARQIYPGLEARRFEDVPRDVWVSAFPLPYEKALRAAAAHANVDPMLVAGLVRQESAWKRTRSRTPTLMV